MQKRINRFHASLPLLCFARGMVVVMLMAVTLVMFNRLDMSNGVATLVTSLFLLPLTLRPFLSPVMETTGQRKWWMVLSLMLFGVTMYVVAGNMTLFPDNWKMWVAFAVASITGACFDASAAENSRELLEKRNFGVMKVMVPSKLMAVVIVMGVMMLLAGNMEVVSRNIEESWTLAFKVATAIVLVVALLLWVTVGKMSETGRNVSVVEAWQQRKKAMADWWKADRRWLFALFVLFFPLHEFFLWRGTLLFLVDKGSIGGLSFSPQEMGFAFCTVATIIAMAGYMMGVECVRKNGLRKWWLMMALAFTVPDAIYVFLAYTMPGELWLVTVCLSVEQWCCGFGIVAFLLYIMYGNGEVCEKVHLDMCWSLVITSIIISGCFTGVMQDYLGYRRFFIAVMAMAIIALCIAGWMAIRRKE